MAKRSAAILIHSLKKYSSLIPFNVLQAFLASTPHVAMLTVGQVARLAFQQFDEAPAERAVAADEENSEASAHSQFR